MLARKQGFDYDALHFLLSEWGFGQEPHLTKMTNVQIAKVLERFDKFFFVVNEHTPFDKRIYLVKRLYESAGWSEGRFKKLLKAKYHKDSFQKLNENEKRGIIAIMRRYSRR